MKINCIENHSIEHFFNYDSFIYILFDRTTRAPFYVGKTGNPKQRLYMHINEMLSSSDTAKCKKMREILSVDPLGIYLVVIEKTDSINEDKREAFWISELHKHFKLTNNHMHKLDNEFVLNTKKRFIDWVAKNHKTQDLSLGWLLS